MLLYNPLSQSAVTNKYEVDAVRFQSYLLLLSEEMLADEADAVGPGSLHAVAHGQVFYREAVLERAVQRLNGLENVQQRQFTVKHCIEVHLNQVSLRSWYNEPKSVFSLDSLRTEALNCVQFLLSCQDVQGFGVID